MTVVTPKSLGQIAARISPSPIPWRIAVVLWTTIVILATIAIIATWPEPYAFHVSQLSFDAAEEIDGKLVPLDDFNIGYERLNAFQRRRQCAWLISAFIGASVVHLIASLFCFRNASILADLLAAIGAIIAARIANATLPPFVDPVYGADGFHIEFPRWIEVMGFVLLTLGIAGVSLIARSILGKIAPATHLTSTQESSPID
jgi:hypothetical protein